MSLLRTLTSSTPISSRLQAERAAQGSAAVWAIIGMLFGFATLANLGRVASGGLPPWAPSLLLGLTAAAMALFVGRLKSVVLAIVTLMAAGLISALAVLALLQGKGNMILVPLFVLPLAISGLRGARALRQPQPDESFA